VNIQLISLNEVLRLMDTGEKFSISFVTANRIKRTGGKIVTIRHAKKLGNNGPQPARYSIAKNGKKVRSRNPDHYKNFTRNIHDMSNHKTIKIHCRLITQFNKKTVRY
jgi:hypothetical protein